MLLRQGIIIKTLPPHSTSHESVPQLTINDGVSCEEIQPSQPAFFPREDWHQPDQNDRAMLVSPRSAQEGSGMAESLFVFSVSESLRTLFWGLDFQNLIRRPTLDCYDYASQYRQVAAEALCYVSALLKEIGHYLSGNSLCQAVFNLPGLRSLRFDPTLGLHVGLGIDEIFGDDDNNLNVSAGINLGDEPRHLLYINLSTTGLREMLRPRADNVEHLAGDELARSFMTEFPSYPVSRLTLLPTQGYVVQTGNLIRDESTLGMSGPDINLLIRAACHL